MLQMPETARKGEEFSVEVSFNNPLSETLTDCSISYEGGGFRHQSAITQDEYVYFSSRYENTYVVSKSKQYSHKG